LAQAIEEFVVVVEFAAVVEVGPGIQDDAVQPQAPVLARRGARAAARLR
jgi:hypothetical protein